VSILIIGGNGFIGSHLVDELAGRGESVTVFDRFRSAGPSFDAQNVRVERGDFFDADAVARVVAGHDTVLHFLSTTTPATAAEDPTLDLRTNIASTVDLLRTSADAGVGRFFYASTGGAIYGDQDVASFSETSPTLPRSPYGIGKLTVERYMDFFRAAHGLDSVSLRISNPYGPRQRAGRRQGLIPIALRNIAEGRPVVRYGDGGMTRDYLFVRDAVRMIADVVQGDPRETVYNIGSGAGLTVSDVLDTIHRVVDAEIEVAEEPVPPSFVERSVLDTTRFTSEFGVPDLTSIDDGIAETWQAIRAESDGVSR
jgi:UDP-glucose 4-epimerase